MINYCLYNFYINTENINGIHQACYMKNIL